MVMLRLKKAGRKCLGEDVETFNDPRHLAIISVKIDFFLISYIFKNINVELKPILNIIGVGHKEDVDVIRIDFNMFPGKPELR